MRGVDPAVADHATGHRAVAHDLRTAGTRDAGLCRIHLAGGEDVLGRIGIGERSPPLPDQRCPPGADYARRNVGHQVSQPTVAGGNHRQAVERFLDPPRHVNQPDHAGQRVLIRRVDTGDRMVVGTAVMRVVVRVADRNVDQRDPDLDQLPDDLDRLPEIGGFVVPAIHPEAVGIGDGIVDVHPRGDEQLGNRLFDRLQRLPQHA